MAPDKGAFVVKTLGVAAIDLTELSCLTGAELRKIGLDQ
jgi:hypothetical protein